MSPNRRDFLKAALGGSVLLSFGARVPWYLGCAARAEARAPLERVLVVLQLTGGNDGLNTVVPFESDEYARSRSTLRLRPEQVLKVGSSLGFHPEMEAFQKLHEQGRLCVVHGVGYPASSRDHDVALRDWHTARPGVGTSPTGWAGRAADLWALRDPAGAPAAFVGPIDQPFAINSESTVVPSIRSPGDLVMSGPASAAEREAHLRAVERACRQPVSAGASPFLDGARQALLAACAAGRRVDAVLASDPAGAYPDFQLARALKGVAQLIRAELGVRIFFVELGGGGIGGFDTHANQGANHGALLRQLSRSVAAYAENLAGDGLLDRTLLVTFSEFGRTVAENGRRGTDHGAAAPIFVVGGKVKGGFLGEHPSLTDLDQGAMRVHTDFRRVYATALERWLGLEARPVLGGDFEPVDFLKA
jgi:uncharacterized protein (DUF1501 family)